MKLLSLRLCDHDSNISYFDGKEVHYLKLERTKQQKMFAYNNLWEWRNTIKEVWNVDYKDIDEISVIIDPKLHSLPPSNKKLYELYEYLPSSCPVWRIDHHYAHSLSAWMLSDYADVSIVIDGVGEVDIPWSVYKDDVLVEEGSVESNGSIGVEMARVGEDLGIRWRVHMDELAGKLMGLQSYGNFDSDFYDTLSDISMYNIKSLFDEGRWIKYKDNKLVAFHTRLDWINTIHKKTGDVLLNFFSKYAKSKDRIIYTGGVAQNVIWNTALKKAFPNLIIPPHCADDGLSLGGLEWLRRKNNLAPFNLENFPYKQSDQSVSKPTKKTLKQVARLLQEGKTVGWYQGNGEIGPRALGNRSILFSPSVTNGKVIVNKIKKRENYRPFGATCLYDMVADDFDLEFENPYMLYVADVKNKNLHSITHIDNTCRVQTINNDSSSLYDLLTEYKKLTGSGVLLNTSLNVNGRPIAGCPEDALELFNESELDVLVVGNKVYE